MAQIAIIGVFIWTCLAPPAERTPLQIGLSFTSTTKAESHTKAAVPDADGAVGFDHVVELINGDFKAYDKRTGKLLLAQTSQAFWDAALGPEYGPNPDNKDPRILFDPQAKRWYASAQRPVSNGDASLVLARSNTANPTEGWKGVAFYVDSSRTQNTNADFDRLAYNADGIYITINHLKISPEGRPLPDGVAVFSIKKSDFNRATPLLTIDRREHLTDWRDVVPAIDHDGRSHTATFWGVSPSRQSANDLFVRGDVSGDAGSWKLERNIVTIGDKPGQLLQRTIMPPISVSQPGGHPVFTLMKQPTTLRLINGEFWLVHTAANPEDSKRSAIRWWRIRAPDNTVLGDGILTDPSLNLLHPSMAVDAGGDIVIACTGTSAHQHLSSYAIYGRVSGDKVLFDSSFLLLKAGAGSNTGGGRWGDYTTTVADPSAQGTFWTFQVYAQANGDWATQIVQFKASIRGLPFSESGVQKV